MLHLLLLHFQNGHGLLQPADQLFGDLDRVPQARDFNPHFLHRGGLPRHSQILQ